MKLVSAKCPNCGANIEVDEHSDKTKCEYCKSKIIVDDAIAKFKLEVSGSVEIKNLPKLENYLKIGDRHYQDEEYEEAYEAYTSAVELDPDNSEAVLRKGLSKALCTNYLNFEIDTALNATKNALKLLKGNKEESLLNDRYILELVNTTLKLEKFIIHFYNSTDLTFGEIIEFINRLEICLSILEFCKDKVYEKSNKILIIKNTIRLIKYILKPKIYNDSGFGRRKYGISFKRRIELWNKKDEYEKQLYILEPKSKQKSFNKNLLIIIIIEFLLFGLSISAMSQAKSPIWGLILLVDFIIVLPVVSKKIFKKEKIGLWIKIVLFFIGMIGFINNSYPEFVNHTYRSETINMVIKFEKKQVIFNGIETEYTYEDKTSYILIKINDNTFKYQKNNDEYLFCLLENNKCKHYFASDNTNYKYKLKDN